jgi:hypothetical protein
MITHHKQKTVRVGKLKIQVDAKIAVAVERVLRAGMKTNLSCECAGNGKFMAYINPCDEEDFPGLRWGSPQEMAEAIGLKKGQWRSRNSVLWFNPADVPATVPGMRLPKRLKHGAYVATFKGIEGGQVGDPLSCATWDIKRGRQLVGRMFVGRAYGWARPYASLTKLVWSGPWPEGASDPRSPDYGMLFDCGPHDSYADTLADFARRADRLIAWRHENKR